MKYGFLKVAAVSPQLKVADIKFNVASLKEEIANEFVVKYGDGYCFIGLFQFNFLEKRHDRFRPTHFKLMYSKTLTRWDLNLDFAITIF